MEDAELLRRACDSLNKAPYRVIEVPVRIADGKVIHPNLTSDGFLRIQRVELAGWYNGRQNSDREQSQEPISRRC